MLVEFYDTLILAVDESGTFKIQTIITDSVIGDTLNYSLTTTETRLIDLLNKLNHNIKLGLMFNLLSDIEDYIEKLKERYYE